MDDDVITTPKRRSTLSLVSASLCDKNQDFMNGRIINYNRKFLVASSCAMRRSASLNNRGKRGVLSFVEYSRH